MWRAQASSRLAACESLTAVSPSTRRIAAIASRAASGILSRTTGSVTTDSGSESLERRRLTSGESSELPLDLSWLGEARQPCDRPLACVATSTRPDVAGDVPASDAADDRICRRRALMPGDPYGDNISIAPVGRVVARAA